MYKKRSFSCCKYHLIWYLVFSWSTAFVKILIELPLDLGSAPDSLVQLFFVRGLLKFFSSSDSKSDSSTGLLVAFFTSLPSWLIWYCTIFFHAISYVKVSPKTLSTCLVYFPGENWRHMASQSLGGIFLVFYFYLINELATLNRIKSDQYLISSLTLSFPTVVHLRYFFLLFKILLIFFSLIFFIFTTGR